MRSLRTRKNSHRTWSSYEHPHSVLPATAHAPSPLHSSGVTFLAYLLTVSASHVLPCPAHPRRGRFAEGDEGVESQRQRVIVTEKKPKRWIEERHPRSNDTYRISDSFYYYYKQLLVPGLACRSAVFHNICGSITCTSCKNGICTANGTAAFEAKLNRITKVRYASRPSSDSSWAKKSGPKLLR